MPCNIRALVRGLKNNYTCTRLSGKSGKLGNLSTTGCDEKGVLTLVVDRVFLWFFSQYSILVNTCITMHYKCNKTNNIVGQY